MLTKTFLIAAMLMAGVNGFSQVGLDTVRIEKLMPISSRESKNGVLHVATSYGYIDLGPQNNAWAHIEQIIYPMDCTFFI